MAVGQSLCGATLAGRRNAGLPQFSNRVRNGNDSEWVKEAAKSHRVMFSDALNYVTYRSADKWHHTWRAGDEKLVKRSALLAEHVSERIPANLCGGLLFDDWS
jgi:hypothetical protein